MNIDLYHDPEANAASLRFSHETGRELVTVPVEFVGEICATITFTPDGKLVELELLDAARQLPDGLRQPPAEG